MLEQHRDLHRLQRVIATLPPDQADAFVLRVVEQLSLEESAAILGARPATISYAHHRPRGLARPLEVRRLGPGKPSVVGITTGVMPSSVRSGSPATGPESTMSW